MIAPIELGNELLEFIPGTEIHVPDPSIPLVFTIVILKYQERYMFLYGPQRQQWEAPGGGINPGESAYDCARREVWEETSQVVHDLTYKGLFKVRIEDRLEYGALFTAEILELKPFVANEESERIMLWKTLDELEGTVSILCTLLMNYC